MFTALFVQFQIIWLDFSINGIDEKIFFKVNENSIGNK